MNDSSVKILHDITPADFDALAMHPMQSYAWGEVRKATGLRVVRFGRYENGELIDVYQMTVHKLPKVSYLIGYVPRSDIPDKATVDFLADWAKKEKIVFIKWEPYVQAETAGKNDSARLLALPHMRISSHPLFTEWNQEVDLTPSEEEIYKAFKKNTRYSVRHAGEAGVTAREMSDAEGFKIFSDLYFSTAGRKQYHGHTRKYHETIWNILSKAGIAHLYVAFYNGEPRAAFEIFFFHDRAYYPYSGSSAADRHIPATQFLMWEVIKVAKAHGAKTLDLWGTLPPDHDKKHPWAGFTLFKSGFGSRYVHMAKSTDQVIMPALYHLYSAVYKLRSLVWKGGLQ